MISLTSSKLNLWSPNYYDLNSLVNLGVVILDTLGKLFFHRGVNCEDICFRGCTIPKAIIKATLFSFLIFILGNCIPPKPNISFHLTVRNQFQLFLSFHVFLRMKFFVKTLNLPQSFLRLHWTQLISYRWMICSSVSFRLG